MGDIRNRHIEGKLKSVIPFGLSVKYCSPEPLGTIFAPIAIDYFRATQEFFFVIKEPAVMVQVLNYNVKSTVTH